jgi:hypothetical protein
MTPQDNGRTLTISRPLKAVETPAIPGGALTSI